MFDITNYKSYTTAKDWINFVAEKRFDKNYSVLLCGNKSDLDTKRAISVDEILDYSKSINATYYETSLVTLNNVSEMKNYILNQFSLERKMKQEKNKTTSCNIF